MKNLTDTAPEVDAMLIDMLRQTPIWRKLQLMDQLNQMAHAMVLSDLHARYPQATADELRRLLADRLLGPELAAKAYGPVPQLEEAPRAD